MDEHKAYPKTAYLFGSLPDCLQPLEVGILSPRQMVLHLNDEECVQLSLGLKDPLDVGSVHVLDFLLLCRGLRGFLDVESLTFFSSAVLSKDFKTL